MFRDFKHANLIKLLGVYAAIMTLLGLLLDISEKVRWPGLIGLSVVAIGLAFLHEYLLKRRKNGNIKQFTDEQFMFEFIDSFTEKKIDGVPEIDDQHKISLYKKELYIDGPNMWQTRIYMGKNVKQKLSSGLIVKKIGGSSVNSKSMRLRYYNSADTSTRTELTPEITYNGDRIKAYMMRFDTPIYWGEKFYLELHEPSWNGCMRTDYDFTFFNAHNYFTQGIDEMDITVHFLSGELTSVKIYVYNKKENNIERDAIAVLNQIDARTYTWKRSVFVQGETYLLMFRYRN